MKKAVADEDFEAALTLKQRIKQINLKTAEELTAQIKIPDATKRDLITKIKSLDTSFCKYLLRHTQTKDQIS